MLSIGGKVTGRVNKAYCFIEKTVFLMRDYSNKDKISPICPPCLPTLQYATEWSEKTLKRCMSYQDRK